MLIKNSLKLLANNLNLVFKVMVYSLIVVVLFLLVTFVFFDGVVGTISKSAEFKAFLGDLNQIWNNFISGKSISGVDLVASFEGLTEAIRLNISSYIWPFIGLILGFYVVSVINSICTYTLTYMMNARMSTFEKKGFMVSLISNIKKSLPFEAWYSLLSALALIVSISVGVIFIVYTFTAISVLSLIIGVWLSLIIFALYLTMTALFRPLTVSGVKFKDLFKNRYKKGVFLPIFLSFCFALIVSLAFNMFMITTTLGAGIVISIPVTQLMIVLMELVLLYSIEGKKYYIDYETIEVPNRIKEDSQNAEFLRDVEV